MHKLIYVGIYFFYFLLYNYGEWDFAVHYGEPGIRWKMAFC